MASESNGLSWIGHLCYRFNDSETDDMLIEEPLKYLSEKLTIAGDSFLQFCSDIVDVLPTSIFNSAEQTLSEEEETTLLPVHETSNDVNIDWEEILVDSSSKETLHSCVAQLVENSEQTVNEDDLDDSHSDFSTSDHSSEGAEKVTDIMLREEFVSKYKSPVNKTTYSPVVEEFVSTDAQEEKLVDSSSDKFLAQEILHSCVAQVVENSEQTVNENELDDAHASVSISEHSSERAKKVDIMTWEEFLREYLSPVDKTTYSPVHETSNDVQEEILTDSSSDEVLRRKTLEKFVSGAQSTEDVHPSDSNSINLELEPPKTVEPDQFLSDSDFDSMNYELEPPKKLEPDELMELSDILAAFASLDEVSDSDVNEEDNEVTEPSYMQNLDESLSVVEAGEPDSDSEQEEFFQPRNEKTFKKRLTKRIDAEVDEEDSETYDEDFSGSDCDWEFI